MGGPNSTYAKLGLLIQVPLSEQNQATIEGMCVRYQISKQENCILLYSIIYCGLFAFSSNPISFVFYFVQVICIEYATQVISSAG